ncbi:DUF2927 domain-containing protein [Yoonia sp. I 8.24]|uniref:DUF2927 domain-containing protein n=1 Tax=Yoonia sp. I 8.24 TaxID=1537229 RepID=UPI001EDE4C82|nr:DUF2927 domain-containing protein [Yoonia sp. I 8.24]MCG3268977.1 DUF2927 domain-containing protein [Yoonia sp. I 8.24]
MQRLGLLAILAGTSACVTPPPEPTPTPPVVEALPPPPVAAEPSADSQRLAVYYKRLQNDLLTQGLLRGDGGGPDTTFTDTILARNFIRIALFNEYRDDSDFRNAQSTVSNLRRWANPIRMKIEFGDTVPYPQRAQDTASVESYAARLSRVTGVPISFDQPRPNYHVLFLGEDDRKAIEPRLRELIPTISTATVRAIVDLPRDQLCVVIGTFDPGESTYSQAIAIIRAEHPNLMRAACIHEELAQGMGLANDSPGARPSIFNDDEEFALLTTHDEMLLRMLYDPRLQAGMDPATAAPIARQIARDMMAQGAS